MNYAMDAKRRQQLVAKGYCVIWLNSRWYVYEKDSGVGFREYRSDEARPTCGGVELPSQMFHLEDNAPLAADLRAIANACYCKSLSLNYCDFCTGVRAAPKGGA